MKILITGSGGFIGKNLIHRLKDCGSKYSVYEFDIDSTLEELEAYTKDCDFVFNFAAVHRPKQESEFEKTNHVFFDELLKMLIKHKNFCPVLYTSSIQATNGSAYGNSKLMAEVDLREYGEKYGARAIVYRLTNTYGRWATPNHHSVVATFCYNIARDLPITVSNENTVMRFYYIDDVIDSFLAQIEGAPVADEDGIFRLSEEKIHTMTLGELAAYLKKVKRCVDARVVPCFQTATEETLYKTFLSYLP